MADRNRISGIALFEMKEINVKAKEDTFWMIESSKHNRSAKEKVKIINERNFICTHQTEGCSTPSCTGYTTYTAKQAKSIR